MTRRAVLASALVLLVLAASCRKKESTAEKQARLANKVTTRVVQLYFESAQFLLAPETRTLPLPENDAAALRIVVQEILRGSANSSVPRPFPADTVLRGAYLLPEGNAVVDLGGPTLSSGWNTGSHAEMIAAYSVVQTLTANFQSVKRVRFLINGQPGPTLGGHIAIDRPLTPMRDLLATP